MPVLSKSLFLGLVTVAMTLSFGAASSAQAQMVATRLLATTSSLLRLNALNLASGTAALPYEWIPCAVEDHTGHPSHCIFYPDDNTTTHAVRFGTASVFDTRVVTSGRVCSAAGLGIGNPMSTSSGNICWYQAPAVAWTTCANDGQTCTFSGTREVRYGTAANYYIATVAGPVSCGASIFGDPDPTTTTGKTCAYGPALTITPTGTGTPSPATISGKKVVGRIDVSQSGTVIENVHIVSHTGPCLVIGANLKLTDAPLVNITVRNVEIGPCKQDDTTGDFSTGVFIVNGAANIVIENSVIHDTETAVTTASICGNPATASNCDFLAPVGGVQHPIILDRNFIYHIHRNSVTFPIAPAAIQLSGLGLGKKGSRITCNVIDRNAGPSLPDSVEDTISLWMSRGLAAAPTEIAYNRLRSGGDDISGTAINATDYAPGVSGTPFYGDGRGSGNNWIHHNTLVGVVNNGILVLTGSNNVVEYNRTYWDSSATYAGGGIGFVLVDYYAPFTVCGNTIQNNRSYTVPWVPSAALKINGGTLSIGGQTGTTPLSYAAPNGDLSASCIAGGEAANIVTPNTWNDSTLSGSIFDESAPECAASAVAVSATLSSGAIPVVAGELLTYTITLTNSGAEDRGYVLFDALPPGASFVSASDDGFLPNQTQLGTAAFGLTLPAATVVWPSLDVPASGTKTVTLIVRAPTPLPDGTTQLANVAYPANAAKPACPGTDPACVVSSTIAHADMQAIAATTASGSIGVKLTITTSCRNAGPQAAANATCAISGAPNGATTSCTPASPAATLASGASMICVTNFTPASAGTVTLTTTAASGTADPLAANNLATSTMVIAAQADMQAIGAASASGKIGATTSVTTSCRNAGPQVAANATCAVVGAPSGASTTCTPAIPVASLAAAAAINCTTHFVATSAGSITLTTTAASATADPLGSNNSAASVVSFAAQADMQALGAASAIGKTGALLSITTSCKNTGPQAAANASCIISGAPSGASTTCTPASPATSLASGAAIHCVTSFTPASAGTYSLLTTAASATSDPTPTNNSASSTALISGPGFVSLLPARLLDTRVGSATTDARFAGGGAIPANGILNLAVLGRGGVPAGSVSAVVLNVTATNPSSNGYLTVWSADSALPNASNINFTPAQTVPNLVIAKVGTSGLVSIFNSSGATDAIADVVGYFTSTSDLTSLTPARLLDTRANARTIDGAFAGSQPLGTGAMLDLTVLGRGAVPASGVTTVVLNLTAVNPTAPGYLSVWPSGSTPPLTSTLNFSAGDTVPNLVLAKLGSNGKVTLFNSAGQTNLVADVMGYFSGSTDLTALVPARLLDTRPGQSTSDGRFAGGGALGAGASLNLNVLGRGGVPASGVKAVALNVTAVTPTAMGYITVWPAGSPWPLASNLNFAPERTVANLVIVEVGTNGQIALLNSAGSTDLVADVVGWFPASP
jgi:uncharacterized repeat protein (TIGR01451 family)